VGVVAIGQRPFRRLLGEQVVAIVVLGIVRGAAGVRHAAYDTGLPRAESSAGRGVPPTPDAEGGVLFTMLDKWRTDGKRMAEC
jgi:hypothetical protein